MAKKMKDEAETALAIIKPEDFAILQMESDIKELIAENTGALGLDQFSLGKVGFPSGDIKAFRLPGPGGDEIVQEFDGIIIGFQDVRVYWATSLDESEGKLPPNCTSKDLITGVGNPGGACVVCPYAQFGSARQKGTKPSKGQACQQRRVLFILRPDSILPMVLSLPPTSVKPCSKYFVGLISSGLPYYGCVTRFSLAGETNAAGIDYAEASFTMMLPLEKELRAKFKSMKDGFAPKIAATNATKIASDAIRDEQRAAKPANAAPAPIPQGNAADDNAPPPAAQV